MRNLVAAGILGLGFLAAACGDDVIDDITNTIDCTDVCQRYSDCFDENYDVSACVDRCEEDADVDDARLERCENCIDDESCTAALFECTADCVGIVP